MNFSLPPLLTLAPLMILWANLHGSFTLGLALLYIFAGFSVYQNFLQRNYTKCWRVVIVTSVVTASALLTPYGIAPAFMTVKLLSMKFTREYLVEWRSPIFQGRYFRLIYLVAILSAMPGLLMAELAVMHDQEIFALNMVPTSQTRSKAGPARITRINMSVMVGSFSSPAIEVTQSSSERNLARLNLSALRPEYSPAVREKEECGSLVY